MNKIIEEFFEKLLDPLGLIILGITLFALIIPNILDKCSVPIIGIIIGLAYSWFAVGAFLGMVGAYENFENKGLRVFLFLIATIIYIDVFFQFNLLGSDSDVSINSNDYIFQKREFGNYESCRFTFEEKVALGIEEPRKRCLILDSYCELIE